MLNGNIGVYKITHKSGKYYIGGTQNIKTRFHIWKSMLRAGKAIPKMQDLYNQNPDVNDFIFEVIEYSTKKTLNKTETKYLQAAKGDKDCLNSYFIATSGKRGTHITRSSAHKIAAVLLGKNTKNGVVRRPSNLIFISPDGIEYNNVKSVKFFAEQHGLSQTSMNALANADTTIVEGWTMKGGELPNIGHVIKYWPESRIRQFYPEYIILGPDNKEYKTFHLHGFQEQHNCTVALENNFGDKNRKGVKRELIGLNKYGQGWRLKGVPTYQITWEGKTYHNVLSVAMFCYTFGIRNDRLKNAFTKPTKYTRKYSIIEDTI
jgi:hypothetical protein